MTALKRSRNTDGVYIDFVRTLLVLKHSRTLGCVKKASDKQTHRLTDSPTQALTDTGLPKIREGMQCKI